MDYRDIIAFALILLVIFIVIMNWELLTSWDEYECDRLYDKCKDICNDYESAERKDRCIASCIDNRNTC
jgi:hypothetical protein